MICVVQLSADPICPPALNIGADLTVLCEQFQRGASQA